MTRDTIKTLLGLIIIVAIVVATFLYGNHQRQVQQKHDAQLSQASPSPSSSPVTTVSTAPVSSPTANNIQGGTKASPTPSASVTPTPTPSAIPDTGASTPLLALGGLIVATLGFKRSQRALAAARMRS